jgi:hypothetical protein
MGTLRRCGLPLAIAAMSVAPVAGVLVATGALAPSPAGAASCNVNVGGGASPVSLVSIQAGIDAATAGQTVCVYPGIYNTDHATGRDPDTGLTGGPNDFNIFVGANATGVTIEGVDATGTPIASAPEGLSSSAAPIIQASGVHPVFGSSNVFVQADNVTLRGFEIDGGPFDIAKSVELVGNGDTVTDDAFTPSTGYSGAGDLAPTVLHGGTGIYISDFHFNPAGSGTSTVQTYTFSNNTFDGASKGAGIYVANGAGWTGPASGRVISGNKFSSTDDAIDFAGPTSPIAWLLYPVGAATITGNTFANTTSRQVIAWGTGGPGVGYISPNWCAIISGNTFDHGAFTWQGSTLCPSGVARTWAEPSGGPGGGDYENVAGLYSTIQQYAINDSQAGDTVQVLAGTYDEPLTINHALTLDGANAGVSGTAVRGPESLVERLAADTGPDFDITTSAPVTINGFHAQFNATDGPDQTGGIVLSLGTANNLTFSNNLVDNSSYANVLLFDDSAATSTLQNNLFTNDHQFDVPGDGTGVVATWGVTPPGTPLDTITYTGNTFSHLTDVDGMPAINLNTVTGTVSGNTFEDIHQYGILLADTLANLSITNNLFDNIHNDSMGSSQNRGSGIRTFEQPNFTGPVTISGNTFSNDYHGVRVANDGAPANLPSGDLLVNRNAFTTDTSDGISLDPATTGTLDGTCNWWGSASGPSDAGPGTGTGITAGATFNPWLVTSNLSGPCVAPPTITAVFDGSTSSAPPTALGVSFTPGPGGPFTGFTVTCGSLNGGPTAVSGGTGSPIFVGGLGATGAYQCTVTASNASGTSAPSAPFTVVLGGPGDCPEIPTTPTMLSEGPGNSSATVSWAPASNCIAGYVVTPYLGGVPQVGLSKLIPGPGTTTVMKGLTNGVTYQFTVAAENGAVVGTASPLTAPITAGAPSAATVRHVARIAKGAIRVVFTTPANNGAPITSYTATCTSHNRGVTKSRVAKASPVTVTGLSPGKVYACTVKATNKRGTGPASRVSAALKA